MTEAAPEGRCPCAACRLEAAQLLLRTGRTAMAQQLLAGLGDAIREEREAYYGDGVVHPRMMVDTHPQTTLLRELARALRRGLEDLRREHLALVVAGAGPLVDAMDALLADAARAPLSVIAEAQRRAEGQRHGLA